jgi:type IV secretory pathway VirB4 component
MVWRKPGCKPKGKQGPEDEAVQVEAGLTDGTTTLADILAPDGYKVEDDLVHVGPDRVVRVGYVADVPGRVSMGWLRELYAGDVDVTITLSPLPNHQVIKDLTEKIQALDAQMYLDAEKGDHREQSPKARTRNGLWQLRDDIQTGGNRMFQASILAAVAAPDRESLVKRYAALEERLAGASVVLRSAYLEQEAAFKAARPYAGGTIWQDCRRNFDVYSALTLMPFYSADLFHAGGVLLGTNLTTGGPVLYNAYLPSLVNHNIFVSGYSGTGKSTMIKVMGMRETPLGVRRVQFDIEDEFGESTEAVGGKNLVVTPGDFVVNPFDLEVDQDRQGRYILNLVEKIADCKSQITAMVELAYPGTTLSPLELSVLEDAIKQEYAERGIVDREPTSIYEEGVKKGEQYYLGRVRKDMPTMSSLYNRLQGMECGQLLVYLKPFLAGNTMGMFDGQSSIDFTRDQVVNLNLSRLEGKALRPMVVHAVTALVWERFVKKEPWRRKAVVIDEAYEYLRHETSAEYMETFASRCRKRTCSFRVSTQRFGPFAAHPNGQAVITNAGTSFLFQPHPDEMAGLAAGYRLSEGEIGFLAGAGKGECLLRVQNGVSVALAVQPTDYELNLAKTTYLEDPAGGAWA